MTTTDRWNQEAIIRAQYFAVRTITMAVVAFVGVTLASVAIGALLVLVIAPDPLSYPGWVDGLIQFLVIGGGVWFVTFLVMSLRALRSHFWFHNHIV